MSRSQSSLCIPTPFLLDLYSLDTGTTSDTVKRQAAALTRLPMTIDELLDRLAVTVPTFARALRTRRS